MHTISGPLNAHHQWVGYLFHTINGELNYTTLVVRVRDKPSRSNTYIYEVLTIFEVYSIVSFVILYSSIIWIQGYPPKLSCQSLFGVPCDPRVAFLILKCRYLDDPHKSRFMTRDIVDSMYLLDYGLMIFGL
jgi:hypothetical protein